MLYRSSPRRSRTSTIKRPRPHRRRHREITFILYLLCITSVIYSPLNRGHLRDRNTPYFPLCVGVVYVDPNANIAVGDGHIYSEQTIYQGHRGSRRHVLQVVRERSSAALQRRDRPAQPERAPRRR